MSIILTFIVLINYLQICHLDLSSQLHELSQYNLVSYRNGRELRPISGLYLGTETAQDHEFCNRLNTFWLFSFSSTELNILIYHRMKISFRLKSVNFAEFHLHLHNLSNVKSHFKIYESTVRIKYILPENVFN